MHMNTYITVGKQVKVPGMQQQFTSGLLEPLHCQFKNMHRSLLLSHATRQSHATRLARATLNCDSSQRTFIAASDTDKVRPDPFARRPNKVCDPYGQGGKPLTGPEAENLLTTIRPEWILQGDGYEHGNMPTRLTRCFEHPDFITAASFLTHVAAVAQMNDHFPSMKLERRLDSKRKQWVVESTVICQTIVLQGLSHHDFFIATVSTNPNAEKHDHGRFNSVSHRMTVALIAY